MSATSGAVPAYFEDGDPFAALLQKLPPKPNGADRPQSDALTPYLNWGDLQDKIPPERQWAVPGWIGMGHATLLVGPGATGKTLLIQQIISCLCLGRAFVGEPAHSVNCLMWACEDEHDELWRRQINISRWLKTGLDDFEGRLHIEPRFGKENTLFGPSSESRQNGWSPLLQELADKSNDTKSQIVVLDNVGQIFGGNENSRYDVTRFINGLCGAMPGKAIILVAHPAKNEGSQYSGSTAWENCVRTRLYLGPDLPDKPQGEADEQDADVRYFAKRKTNYSQKDYRTLRFTDGLLLPDEINAQGGLIGHLVKQKAENTVINAVQKLYLQEIRTVSGASSPDFLVKRMEYASLTDGVRKQELAMAFARLMADGKIVEVGFSGRAKNRTKQSTLALG